MYSVDKVRMQIKVTEEKLKKYMKKYEYDNRVVYWESYDFKSYKYNWNLKIDSGIYMAYKHNSEKFSSKYIFVLEYNPNKIVSDEIKDIIKYFFIDRESNINKAKIKYVDVAIDIKENILDLFIEKNGKRIYKIFSKGGDDLTYYVGMGDGRVKVYNKKKESNLNIEHELTRYEITMEINMELDKVHELKLKKYDMPKLYLYKNDLLKDGEERLVMMSLLQYPEMINTLSRRKKEKYKKLLNEQYEIEIEEKKIEECIKKYFIKMKEELK